MKPTMSAEEFKAYRISLNFTHKDMAQQIGVTPMAIKLWETNQRRIPETTVRLVKLFKKFPQVMKEF